MRRIVIGLLLPLLVAPGVVSAQSSQFGIRGLGIPVRPLSPRALATGGALGLFDLESSQNPAAVATINVFTASFSSAQNFRSSTNPFGTSSGRDGRFPQIMVAGPIGGTRLAAAVSLSGYTDRNFALGTADTIELRGALVGVFDTLSSRGGLSDLRVAGGWRVNQSLQLGLGLHAITGSNRMENRRVFSDTSYFTATERTEISYLGLGVSAGVTVHPTSRLALAGTFRSDGHLTVDRDTARTARTDLPTSWSLGARWLVGEKLSWSASYSTKNWSSADPDIRQQGGLGAFDAYQVSTGFELIRDLRNPGHRPWRIGGFYGTLPFPLVSGRKAKEYGLSAGTGFRFTGGRGGLDLTLQQLWRGDGQGYTERATIVTLGFSIRP